MTQRVSRHGVRRVRERLKLPARATPRHVAKVRLEGTYEHNMSTVMRMRCALHREKHPHNKPTDYILHRGFFYIVDRETGALITVFPEKTPEIYR